MLRLNLLLRVTGALCGRSLPAYSKSVGAWLVGLVRPWARVCKSSFYRPKLSMLASTQWSRSVHCLSKFCTLFNWWPHEKEERRQDYLPNRRDSTCSHFTFHCLVTVIQQLLFHHSIVSTVWYTNVHAIITDTCEFHYLLFIKYSFPFVTSYYVFCVLALGSGSV